MLAKTVVKVLLIVQAVNIIVAGTFVYVHTGGLDTSPLGIRGTYASFSDTELSDGNVLFAGDWVLVPGCHRSYGVPPPPPGATYTNDPGFAFRDVGCDGAYNAGIDIAIALADVQDGAYDAGTGCLVIPPSVGPISAGTVTYNGKKVTVLVNLTATGSISVTASEGLTTRDVRFQAGSAVTVTTVTGLLSMRGVTVGIANGNLVVDQTGTPGSLDITGAHYKPNGNIRAATKGDLLAPGTIMQPGGNIQFLADGFISAEEAALDAVNGNIQMRAGRGADWDGVVVRSGTGNFVPTIVGPFDMRDGCLRVSGNLNIETLLGVGVAEPRIRIDGCTGISETGRTTFTAAAGPMNMSSVDMTGTKTLFVAPGNIDARFGFFNATTEVSFDLRLATRTFYTEGAHYHDQDNNAVIKPAGVTIVGTPAFGGTSY